MSKVRILAELELQKQGKNLCSTDPKYDGNMCHNVYFLFSELLVSGHVECKKSSVTFCDTNCFPADC